MSIMSTVTFQKFRLYLKTCRNIVLFIFFLLMFTIVIVLTTIITVLRLKKIMNAKDDVIIDTKSEMSNGATWIPGQYWNSILHQYCVPFMQFWISFLYGIYLRLTFMNAVIFFLKYIPTAIYIYTLIKNIYVTSQARIKQKQIELEDIQLQIQIINTKLSVRDAEFTERAEELERSAERLRRVRARVRHVIATDDVLRRALQGVATWDTEQEIQIDSTSNEDCQLIVELLKDFKCDPTTIPERQTEKMDCGEHASSDPSSTENNVYSTLSDIDMRQDCRVKIVKVTNVYKVAYLKHFIRQKYLRRATKQAMMKKKMEDIKRLLEEWQKKLNKVINNKLTILNIDTHPFDVASREARGDYSKVAEASDSDIDLRNSTSDVYHDEYNLSWTQNPYKSCAYNYEYVPEKYEPEPAAASEQKHEYYGDVNYSEKAQYDYRTNMFSITEETSSQIAIEEVKGETDVEAECTDIVAI